MIPGNPNIYDSRPELGGAFLYPDNIVSTSELEDYELGGVAIQDPSQGLQVQVWKCHWEPTTGEVILTPQDTGSPTVLFTQSDVVELAFTFDQNMRWSTATRTSDDVLHHRWYDSLAEDYVTTTYSGVTSVRLTHDDKRSTQVDLGSTDMILSYIRVGYVRWRIQRDRFLTEYSYTGQAFTDLRRITHFGMSTKNRLQWRIATRRIQT